jgi:predicted ArsR family transcriptional regulator
VRRPAVTGRPVVETLDHTDLVCGMNLAIVEGMLGGLPPLPLAAVLDPGEGRCCVRLAAADRADL